MTTGSQPTWTSTQKTPKSGTNTSYPRLQPPLDNSLKPQPPGSLNFSPDKSPLLHPHGEDHPLAAASSDKTNPRDNVVLHPDADAQGHPADDPEQPTADPRREPVPHVTFAIDYNLQEDRELDLAAVRQLNARLPALAPAALKPLLHAPVASDNLDESKIPGPATTEMT